MTTAGRGDGEGLSLLGFLHDIALARRGVSGTLALLEQHLFARGVVSEILDVDLSPAERRWRQLLDFSPDKVRWGFKAALNLKTKLRRSQVAEVMANRVERPFNACLQIGSEFRIHPIARLRDVPKFSYHDNNLAALLKSSPYVYDLPGLIERALAFERDVYEHLDGIFTMTEFVRRSFVEDFSVPEQKVHCAGFGTNMTYESCARDYDGRTILFLAKDSFEGKGGKVLLDAFETVRANRKGARLILAGQELNVQAPGVEVVGFIDKREPGGVERLKELYRSASLFVLPSYAEAAGNVFLEAMSNKTPCVGADRGSTPEIIVGSRCGRVTEPGNARVLADTLLELLDDEKGLREMGENGFAAIEEKYNWTAVCDKVLGVMRGFL